jgi:predicted AAA+ superfamily ATPase
LEHNVQEALKAHPVIVLTGPRQVGKSTLLENAPFLKEWRYLTLDDPDALDQAREDPKGLLWEDRPTIIDEVQRCPELLLTVKYFVDKSHRQRYFILSGSGNISLRRSPRETLAGRAKYLHLTGFGFREYHSLPPQGVYGQLIQGLVPKTSDIKGKGDILKAVWRGCLPGVVLATSEKTALDRMSAYVDTYIQRDIQDLVKIRHPQNFRRLMEALAKATGWESVQEKLSNDCGETRSNVSRHISLLQDTSLLYELKGYSAKRERAYKQAKYYWFDSGMACFLSGIYDPDGLQKPHIKGRYLENFVFQQILAWASLQMTPLEMFYWKPKASAAEVDFVVQAHNRVVGIEVKSAQEVTFKDTQSMREFLKIHPGVSAGIIVYTGQKVYPLASNIHAVPWTMF